MNCLTMAIWIWLRRGCSGRIGILEGGNPFPHFAVFSGHWAYHYRAYDVDAPWYKQLWFRGEVVKDWTGPGEVR